MNYLTNDKLVIVGAAGMIGSNMTQTALMLGLTPNITLYDVFSAEGVAEEMRQCGFGDANIVETTDAKEAFTGAKYVISSGGAPRKEGMTREDLLVGNSKAAEELGQNIKKFCPDAKFCVVIFNPADITGLVTLVHSGLRPNQVATLAALDSTRLKGALAKHFGVSQSEIKNAYMAKRWQCLPRLQPSAALICWTSLLVRLRPTVKESQPRNGRSCKKKLRRVVQKL